MSMVEKLTRNMGEIKWQGRKRTDALLRSIPFVLSFAGLSVEAKRENSLAKADA